MLFVHYKNHNRGISENNRIFEPKRGLAKPLIDVQNLWLGRWFLLQTFDNDTDCDVAEIRQLLDDPCDNTLMSEKRNLINHVWFDVNGTLALYTDEYNAAHDQLRYATYADVTDREVDDNLKKEYEKLYREQGSNSMVFRSLGRPSDFWMKRFNKLEEGFAYSPVPAIYETLEKLKGIVPISIFTNNSLNGTEKILREINVNEDWFTHIITGDEIHERKPDLHGYRLAVERSGLPASENLYVGDRVKADVIPAKAVGMKACLVYSHSDEADYSFDKFDELLTLFS